jgi:hypothetical protein
MKKTVNDHAIHNAAGSVARTAPAKVLAAEMHRSMPGRIPLACQNR